MRGVQNVLPSTKKDLKMNNLRQFLKAIVVCSIVFNSVELSARDENKSGCFSCHNPEKKKRTCAPTPISHATTITKSGSYCLTRDIEGTIVIAHDDVCLDLNCHEIDADGNLFGIVMQNVQDVKIFNGSVSNATDAGILVGPSISIELADLFMHGNALDSIRTVSCTDLNICNVDFDGSEAGERAILCNGCNNVNVSNCNMSGFLSTLGAVLELNVCNNATLQDVNVSNCTKTSIDCYYFTAPTAFVYVGGPGVILLDNVVGCTNVNLVRVNVNNNTVNNTVTVTDPRSAPFGNWRTFESILINQSSNCTLSECKTSNNTDITGSHANVDTEDYFLCLLGSENSTITEHQSNNNSCPATILTFVAGAIFDAKNIMIDGCQFNSNFIQNLAVVAGAESLAEGLFVQGYFVTVPNDVIVRNTQANFNKVKNGGAGRNKHSLGSLTGIDLVGRGIVADHCQANHNSIGDSQPFTEVIGMVIDANVLTAFNSSADENHGGEYSLGMITFGGHNRHISQCSACNNGNYGFVLGSDPIDIAGSGAYILLEDSIAHLNGGNIHDAAGIIASLAGSNNIVVKGCQVYGTNATSAIDGSAAAIKIVSGSNIVIEDTNVFNTTSKSFEGHGILFDSCLDSKIIRCQAHENQNAGIELVGTNTNIAIIGSVAIDNAIGFEFNASSTATCCLVQDCRALSNTVAGFVYGPAEFSTTFIGNEAQCNGTSTSDDYENLVGKISLQELHWADGSITNVSGDANTGPWTNFIAGK